VSARPAGQRPQPAEAPRVTIEILGPFRVGGADRSRLPVPQAQQRIVLAALALAGEPGMSADGLLSAIWGDEPPRSARKTLHGYIARLRRLLGPGVIMTRPDGYCLSPQRCDLDASRAQSLLDAGRSATVPGERLRLLGCALALFRGEPLDGVPSASLDTTYAAPLRDTGTLVLESWAREQIRADPQRAVGPLRDATARQPHRESLWALLVEALAAAQRRAEALECYQQARRALIDDLGIEPGPGLRHAQRRALGTAPGPAGPPADPAPGRAAELAGRLRRQRAGGAAIAVTGPPGAGKTRVTADAAAAVAPDFAAGPPVTVSACPAGGAAPAAVAASMLRAWGLAPADDPPRELAGAWARRRALIVLDDVASVTQFEWLLPVPPQCALAVCTTMPRDAVPGLDVFDLEPYPLADVLELLGRARPAAPAAFTGHAARTLDRILEGLPAAVHALAARLAREPGLEPGEITAHLQDPRRRLSALTSRSIDVRMHLQRAYDRLSDPARRAFRLLGWLDSHSFSEAVAAAALQLPGSEVRELAAELSRLGLLHAGGRGTERRHRISPLGRSLAREISEYTDSMAVRDAAVSRALRAWQSSAVSGFGLSAGLQSWGEPTGARPLMRP
jgi:DNA-binding SARP family transcriptional activator